MRDAANFLMMSKTLPRDLSRFFTTWLHTVTLKLPSHLISRPSFGLARKLRSITRHRVLVARAQSQCRTTDDDLKSATVDQTKRSIGT